jgi:hypothetical protein
VRISKIRCCRQEHLPKCTPIALNKINHHQPFLLVRSSEDKVAIDTYSLFVAPSIMFYAIGALASCTCSRLDRSAFRAYSSTVPAFSRDSAFVRIKLEFVSTFRFGLTNSTGGWEWRMIVNRKQHIVCELPQTVPTFQIHDHHHMPPLPVPLIISPTRQFSTQRLLNTFIPAPCFWVESPTMNAISCRDGK